MGLGKLGEGNPHFDFSRGKQTLGGEGRGSIMTKEIPEWTWEDSAHSTGMVLGGITLSFENFGVVVIFLFLNFSKNGFLMGEGGVCFWLGGMVYMYGMFGYIDRKEKEKAGGRGGV